MRVIKGFVTHANFFKNEENIVNPIGELSPIGMTYVQNKGNYTFAVNKDITLITFNTTDNAVFLELTADEKDHVLSVSDFIYQKSISTAGEIYADVLLTELITAFQTSAESFKCGEIVTDGTYYIPEWVSWKIKSHDPMVENSVVRVWFSDSSFCSKFDDYKIVVVPPIKHLDDFFRTGAEVEQLIKAIDPTELAKRVQSAKDGYPETIIRVEVYQYHDPLNASRKVNTPWTLLIYGAQGNNIDSIKDAIIDHILDNSSHTREEWAEIFPDIFKRTEFVILGLWDQYAIENKQIQAGIYSPILRVKNFYEYIKDYVNTYPEAHVKEYGTAMGHPYKSLCLLTASSNENRDNTYLLTDMFPDFISVSSTSQDFNRMSENTRGFAELLFNLLLVAEEMGRYTMLPTDITRTIRNNKLFAVASYNNVHFLVAAKNPLENDY